jgi:hypothetical protein
MPIFGADPAAGAASAKSPTRTAPLAQEARIPAYDPIDRALKTHKHGSRRLSLIIVVLGLIAVAAALYFSPDRRRRREAVRLPLDADTAQVLRTLGPRPTRCPPGAMEHLADGLGWLQERDSGSALAQLKRDTRQRWLYPGRRGCMPQKGETELGIDAGGRMLWIQPDAPGEVRLSPRISY